MWFQNIFSAKPRPEEPPAGPANPAAPLLSSRTLRLLNHMALNTGPLLPRQPVGSRPSRSRRPAADFLDQRQYVPGDDVRYVDWKASARQEHIYIKQGEHQQAAFVYVLIDCSASMQWGRPPKAEAALALARALGYLALAHNDRLLVMPVTAGLAGSERASTLHPLGPLWGKGQMQMLNQYLQALRFQGEVSLTRTLLELSRRGHSNGGLVLILSDLFGVQNLSRTLEALPTPTWSVVFCHLLHPEEIHPGLNGYFEMQDIETGQKKRYRVTPKVLETYQQRMKSWQEEIAQACQEKQAVYTRLTTGASLENEMIPRLLQARVVKRL